MKFKKSKVWILHLIQGSPGLMYRLEDERLENDGKGLEGETFEEWLRGGFSSELRGGLMAAAAPQGNGGAAVSSALCDSDRVLH